MSDSAVSSLISEMENYLKETELPDTDYIVAWNDKFHAAVDAAERGAGWQDIVDRAHALGEAIQKRIGGLNYEREQIRRELQIQSVGARALKGYSSGIK
jgi:flagellar hook-associated protein FlgK